MRARQKSKQREGKRQQHRKHTGTKTQKKGTCRSSEVNNKIRPWSTWRKTTRHWKLNWEPSHRKDDEYTNLSFFAVLTKFILFGEANRKTNEYLNWSFRALHPNQPRDLFHGMLTKMSPAESPDNQSIGTCVSMEIYVWVREQLCMGFSWVCEHLCRICGTGSDRPSPS